MSAEEEAEDATSRLDDEILTEVFRWIGDGSYLYIAGTSPRFRKIYRRVGTFTSGEQMVQTVAGARLFFNEARVPRLVFPRRSEQATTPYYYSPYTDKADFVCGIAAVHGNIDVLQLACGWGRRFDTRTAFRLAASFGHLHVLEWLVQRYRDCAVYDFSVFDGAAYRGQLEVLQWAIDKGYKWGARSETSTCAARGGHLKILRWLREQGCPWHGWTCTAAAEEGHLSVLQWLREQGCPWDTLTCAMAAYGGHFEVLKWAREHDCPWLALTCAYAAASGHLLMLKWAREHGCPWDSRTCSEAACGGHLEVLQWARANGCPWDYGTVKAAERAGHTDVVDWALQNGLASYKEGGGD